MLYYMPTKVLDSPNVVLKNPHLFSMQGKRALIVSGKASAKLSGALADVLKVLEQQKITYFHCDKIPENPSLEDVVAGATFGASCEFIIAIGGGSPIDAAKAIGVLIKNGLDTPYQTLFETAMLTALPLIAIPTTAGTGTETTPYAILTDHQQQTKRNFSSRVFPDYALIDVRYFMTMPKAVRLNTCVDALTHLIESYMNSNATVYSDYVALEGLRLWGTVKQHLKADDITPETMHTFVNASTLAGIAISQTGTSLPHGMGYALTYYQNIPHGKANGLLMRAYLMMCRDADKVQQILNKLGFKDLDEMGLFLQDLLGTLELKDEEINNYSQAMAGNQDKLKNHPDQVGLKEIKAIFQKSLA